MQEAILGRRICEQGAGHLVSRGTNLTFYLSLPRVGQSGGVKGSCLFCLAEVAQVLCPKYHGDVGLYMASGLVAVFSSLANNAPQKNHPR